MQDTDTVPKPVIKTHHGLKRERNLRNQHNRSPANSCRPRDQLHIHLGLATAGHTLYQIVPILPHLKVRIDRIHDHLLLLIQSQCITPLFQMCNRIAVAILTFDTNHMLFFQRPHDGCCHIQLVQDNLIVNHRIFNQGLQQPCTCCLMLFLHLHKQIHSLCLVSKYQYNRALLLQPLLRLDRYHSL